MLEENRRVRLKIPTALEPLMGLHLAKLDEVIEPGLTTLTWSSTQIGDYIERVYSGIGELELLADRVYSVTECRIDAILKEMASMILCELPEDEPWTIEHFLWNTQVSYRCRTLHTIFKFVFFSLIPDCQMLYSVYYL